MQSIRAFTLLCLFIPRTGKTYPSLSALSLCSCLSVSSAASLLISSGSARLGLASFILHFCLAQKLPNKVVLWKEYGSER